MNKLMGSLLAATLMLITCWSGLIWGAETSLVARVLTHSIEDGPAVSAVVLRAAELPTGIVAHDHIILIDTSASQVGEHRQQALVVLESLLKSLPVNDRVRLFAIDLQSEPLDDQFNGPQSEAVQDSLELLKSRVPLGATNLEGGLRTVLPSISNRPSDITYLGDGMSAADLVEIPELRSLVAELRQRRVPIHSYCVGPQKNLQLLGILALHTGGFVTFDSQFESSGTQIQKTKSAKLRKDIAQLNASAHERAVAEGRKLAEALQVPVFFPTELQFSVTGTSMFPSEPLPMRSDRDTIYVTNGSLPIDSRLVLSNAGLADSIEWTLGAPQEMPSATFLPVLAQQLEQTGGLTNSLAGMTLFQLAQVDFTEQVTLMAQRGWIALQHGDTEQAGLISEIVARVDPKNTEFKALRNETVKRQMVPVKHARSRTQAADPAGVGSDPNSQVTPNPNASLLEDQDQMIRVQTMKLRNEVSGTIDAARKSDDSEAALGMLKRILSAVRSAIDIARDDRERMEKQLDTEILQQENLKEYKLQEQSRRLQQMAQEESLKRLSEQATLDEERLENLIERVRALMLEGRHGRDDAYAEAQLVSDVAINLRPGEGTSSAARFDSESAQQLNRAYRMRARRADQLLETMYQVELSQIPFPDEPPIRFPPAEVWKALSARRKERATVDLKRTSPNERRIKQALSESTEVSFTDNPLEEALNYLEDLHHIEIWIDKQALQDEGINVDTQVTLVMSGITLRSVLRLLLDPLALTYVIEDEVMKITTQTRSDEKMSTRVYPVADLVMPVRPPMMMGGMGGGMMGGGMGGMGGGMMGGMGGGMMGGMGGMGGGMGMFSVPPEMFGHTTESKLRCHPPCERKILGTLDM